MIRRSFTILPESNPLADLLPSYYQQMQQTLGQENFHPLFYDIETTGSDRHASEVYLIGLLWPDGDRLEGLQLFAETPEEEGKLLTEFCGFLPGFTCTVQFYGDRFDQPYLTARCQDHGLPDPFAELPSLDLYAHLLPFKKLLGLPNLQQTTLEKALLSPSRVHPDGRKCITIYQASQQKARNAFTEALFGHNEEDLRGMAAILPMVSYFSLLSGRCTVQEAQVTEDSVRWTLALPQSLPLALKIRQDGVSLCAEAGSDLLTFEIPRSTGGIRQYYENYRDYVYLPEEDMAVPKSLGSCLPRSHKKNARPETCYTWISLTEEFLQDFDRQDQFVQHNLPLYLKLL